MPTPPLKTKPVDPVETAHAAWAASPNDPAATRGLLDALAPDIRKAAVAYLGDDPLAVSKAKEIALKAARTYDPSKGAALRTHVYGHMRGLQRYAANRAIIKLPEQSRHAAAHVREAEQGLLDELGRPPNVDEVARKTGFSSAKVKKLRRINAPVSQSRWDGDSEDPGGAAVSYGSRDNAWHFVFHDLNDRDKAIVEMLRGGPGQKPASAGDVAKALKISPGLVSQRAAAIQKMVDDVDDSGVL